MKPTTLDAYQLLHEGSLVLSQIEANGIRIDTDYLDRAIEKTDRRIARLDRKLREDKEVWPAWRRAYGRNANLGAKQQLGHVLFKVLGYKSTKETAGKKASVDASVLEGIDLPFVKDYLAVERHKRMRGTFLEGIKRETVDGFLHPIFNLNTVQTFRSSSDSPNFQNFPVRDDEMSKVVRSCFISRKNHQLVESDFGGIEVRISACYNKDPVMIRYLIEGYDYHKEYAALCYKVKPEAVSKDMRYCAKNRFVFPEFYGSYYVECAKHLWGLIERKKLEVGDGLVEAGYQSFERHIKRVEEKLWSTFCVYAKWKESWLKAYIKTGGFALKTGFVINGVYSRNEVINFPIQGSAFHCLLWCLIKLQKWLAKNKMKTKIVGQIHDSIIADVHKDEMQDYLMMVRQIMTVDIMDAWKWIIVPLEVEIEASPPGGSWYDKKKVEV